MAGGVRGLVVVGESRGMFRKAVTPPFGFQFYCRFFCCAEAVLKSSIFRPILQVSQQIAVNRTAPSWALPVGTSAAASRGDKSGIITMHYPEPVRDLMGF